MDPISIGLAGAGLITGGIQALIGGNQAKKARRALERLKTPTRYADTAISDYYNQAKNPYSSLSYLNNMQQINRNTAGGISALQSRRQGLAGIASLIRAQNDASLQAGAQAQSRLGEATRMKAADNDALFRVNKMMPYEKEYSLLASKAAGGNQLMNAGLQSISGGLNMAGMIGLDAYNNRTPKTVNNGDTN